MSFNEILEQLPKLTEDENGSFGIYSISSWPTKAKRARNC
jgi:hypothetical protein